MTADQFAALYEEHVDRVFRYIARRLGRQLAEELTAQAFSEAWAGRDRFDPERGTFLVWMYGIASHLVSRHNRTESRRLRAYARTGRDPLLDDDAGLERAVERVSARESWPAVADALAHLRPAERTVLLLWGWDGLTYEQIAQALDIPMGTVRSRLSRARAKVAARGVPT